MLGSAVEDDSEAKSDMRTLQVRALFERRVTFCRASPVSCRASPVSCCSRARRLQMVLEKQLQDIIRYTNELENREATM